MQNTRAVEYASLTEIMQNYTVYSMEALFKNSSLQFNPALFSLPALLCVLWKKEEKKKGKNHNEKKNKPDFYMKVLEISFPQQDILLQVCFGVEAGLGHQFNSSAISPQIKISSR